MGDGKSNGDHGGGSVFVLLVILVLIVGIVAAAGLVLAVLNYNREDTTPVEINVEGSGSDKNQGGYSSGSNGYDYTNGQRSSEGKEDDVHYDTRIWNIQFSGDGYRRISYIDRKNRQPKGFLTDLVNAVCLIAGKNCELVNGEWPTCWDNGSPQEGLLGRWYDACALWGTSLDRLRSYKFSLPYTPTPATVFLTLPGNPTNFDPDNLDGTKIGFLGGWWSDRFCLLFSTNQELEDDQISVYFNAGELLDALNNREVDAVFVSNELPFVQDGSYNVARELTPCLQGGDAMMMRKDSLFKDWWDPAYQKLINSRTYREICNDIEDPNVHGHVPGRTSQEICGNL